MRISVAVFSIIFVVVAVGILSRFSDGYEPYELERGTYLVLEPESAIQSPTATPTPVVTPPPVPEEILPVNPVLTVAFSHTAGFYAIPFTLTMYTEEGATIHYTLDGSIPTTSSPVFDGSMRINPPEPGPPTAQFDSVTTSRVTVVSINAIAVLDGEASEVMQANFVIGTDVYSRFCENTLIFALNSCPHGLWDYYDGILVEGIDRTIWRQDYVARNGRQPVRGYDYGNETPAVPANFNRRGRDSEREVFVQMFDHLGELHISQRAGVRVRGGFSRAIEPQKSLELFAREEYGDRNNFRFPFFGEVEMGYDGNPVDRYRRIRLRNGGSDRQAGFIRDELSQTLFRQAGHSTTQLHAPAAVFLNGDYYGVAWLKSPRTYNHLRRMFGGESDNFAIIEGGDQRFIPSRWHGEYHATSDMHQVSALAMAGFVGEGGDERFEEFSRRIDVDALIRYYAMQIYINNVDWPNHNFELWRYFPTEEELADPDLHPYLRDGRWRVFAHDLESGWGMWDYYNRMAQENTIQDILQGDNPHRWNSWQSSAFLYAFVERDDTRAQLANTFVDLMYGAFAPTNIIAVLGDLEQQIDNELNHALRANRFYVDNLWWPNPDGIRNSRGHIRRFAETRPNYMYQHIRTSLGFDWDYRFEVTTTVGEGGSVVMNSRPIYEWETVTKRYFADTTIRITARPNRGYIVDYWLVNGVRMYGDVVTVGEDAAVMVNFTRG